MISKERVGLVEKYKISSIVTAATDKPLVMMSEIAEKYAFTFPKIESIFKQQISISLKRS